MYERIPLDMETLQKNVIMGALGQSIFSRKFLIFDALDSTNDHAKEMADKGSPEGTVIIAEEQKAGRGRLGRAWISPKHSNLLMSVLLRPEIDLPAVFALTVIMALSVTDSIYEIFGLKTGIKWPNDIYFEGKKLGGILTEISVKGDRIEYAVVGLGLNINWKPEDMAGMRYAAVCIKDAMGSRVPRERIVYTILLRLESYYRMISTERQDDLYESWRRRSIVLGKWVEVDTGERSISGRVIWLDNSGNLVLKDSEGREKKILYGDVSVKEIRDEGADNRKDTG